MTPGADPYGGGGPPTDSPPPPTEGSKNAGNDGIIPPGNGTNSAGGDARCPNGYNRVSGYWGGGYFSGSATPNCGNIGTFTATAFPTVTYKGEYIGHPYPGGNRVQEWDISWYDPVANESRQETAISILNPSFTCIFEIGAYSYSCELDDGSAGPTVSNASGSPILYRTKDGDTMRNISERFYGTPNRAEDIQNANPWLMGLDNWALGGGLLLTLPN